MLMKLNRFNDYKFIFLMKRPFIQVPACLCSQRKIRSRSTALLWTLSAQSAESAPRKAVDSVSKLALKGLISHTCFCSCFCDKKLKLCVNEYILVDANKVLRVTVYSAVTVP